MKMKNIIHAAYECLWKFLETFFFCQAVYVMELYLKKEDYQTMAPKIIKIFSVLLKNCQRKEEFCVKIFFKEKKLIP